MKKILLSLKIARMTLKKTVYSAFHKEVFRVLEHYKWLAIVVRPEDIQNDVVMVYDPEKDTLFIVGMDDSKQVGYRTFTKASVEDAKAYIDLATT